MTVIVITMEIVDLNLGFKMYKTECSKLIKII